MNNEKKKVTKFINIGILDIRNAGDKDLGEVKMINVAHILHTPETIDLLKRGGKRINVGQFVEANPEARVLLSPTTFTDEYFSQQDSALELLAFAPIMVDWETTPEAIEKGLARLDIYGGPEAQVPQIEEREVEGFEYLWDQDDFNPITGDIRCYIHFQFPDGSRLDNAFSYNWRLWSLPETCDLLRECGFRKVIVYWEGTDKDGEPSGVFQPDLKGDLAPSWVSYIIAFP